MKLIMVSTKDIKCGVAEYTKILIEQFKKNKIFNDIIWLDSLSFEDAMDYSSPDNILHVQYAPGIYPPEFYTKNEPEEVLRNFKGLKVITAHHYSGIDKAVELVDRVIVHDAKYKDYPKCRYLVQGCPVYNRVMDKEVLRKELSIPLFAKVIVSYGFMMDWKKLDYAFENFAKYLVLDPNLYLILLHSVHDFAKGTGGQVREKFQQIIAQYNLSNKVKVNHEFLPKETIHKYLRAADVGILFSLMNIDSQGSSAVMKEFVSVQTPVIATNISHYADIDAGIIKVPIGKIQRFIYKTLDTVYDEELLWKLEQQMFELYKDINYDEFAKQHCEVYRSLRIPTPSRGTGVRQFG